MKYMSYYQSAGDFGEWKANPGDEDRIISSPEAAKEMGIKPQTLRLWRSRGEGPVTTPLGKRQGYRVADLVRFRNKVNSDLKQLKNRDDWYSRMKARRLLEGDVFELKMMGYKEVQYMK